jgi:hypothetical protein
MDYFAEFQKILSSVNEARRTVLSSESVQEPHLEFYKIAIIGYSESNTISDWGKNHIDALTQYMEECTSVEHSRNIKLFCAYALGCFMGKLDAHVIDHDAYEKMFVYLPGFVYGCINRIEGAYE